MSNRMLHTAREVATLVSPLGYQWQLFYGDLVDRDGLAMFAACLDKENPMQQEEYCYYVAGEDGSLGITLDNGLHVEWLAKMSVAAPEEEVMPIAETPIGVIKNGIKEKIKSLQQITFKKAFIKVLIAGMIMLLMWVGTMLWQRYCAEHGQRYPFIVKFLAYISFANGGVSSNVFYMIGGFFGKMFVMGTLIAIVLGGFKKMGRGFGGFIRNLANLNSMKMVSLFLMGIGVACVLYNFFTGRAFLRLSMVGIAGFFSMIWAIGGGVNFIRRMTVALTAHVNRRSKVHYISMGNAMSMMTGMAVGFVISIPLSAIHMPYAPYVVGAYFMVLAGILALFKKPGNGKATLSSRGFVILALLALPAIAKAEGWALVFDRAECYNREGSDYSAAISPGYHEEYDELPSGPITLPFHCSTPPKIIRMGDTVTLTVSDIA